MIVKNQATDADLQTLKHQQRGSAIRNAGDAAEQVFVRMLNDAKDGGIITQWRKNPTASQPTKAGQRYSLDLDFEFVNHFAQTFAVEVKHAKNGVLGIGDKSCKPCVTDKQMSFINHEPDHVHSNPPRRAGVVFITERDGNQIIFAFPAVTLNNAQAKAAEHGILKAQIDTRGNGFDWYRVKTIDEVMMKLV